MDSVTTPSIGAGEPTTFSDNQNLVVRVAALEFLLVELFSHLAAMGDRNAPRAFAIAQSIQMKNSFEKIVVSGVLTSHGESRSKEIGETIQTIMNAVVSRFPRAD